MGKRRDRDRHPVERWSRYVMFSHSPDAKTDSLTVRPTKRQARTFSPPLHLVCAPEDCAAPLSAEVKNPSDSA